MKITIVGSHFCPNTLYSIVQCKAAGISVAFVDLSGSLSDLKKFLAIHEHDPIYAEQFAASAESDYAQSGKIGLPCFILEDGTKTLDLKTVLSKAH